MKITGRIISSIAIVSSVAWYYFEPGFEPVITTLGGIAGLLFTFTTSKPIVNNLVREYDALKARWNAEKAIKPASLDDARWLISEALDFVFNFRSLENTDQFHSEIDELAQKLKITQNMSITLDGGKSYNKFWHNGTEALEAIHEIIKKI